MTEEPGVVQVIPVPSDDEEHSWPTVGFRRFAHEFRIVVGPAC